VPDVRLLVAPYDSGHRDARMGAKPGDLIPTRVADQIRTTVADDFRHRNPDTKRAVFTEIPEGVQPVINKTVPDTATLATVPPLLLNSLPRLPMNAGTLTVGAILVAVGVVAASLIGALLGGLAGMRYHRRVDRAGLAR